MYSLECLCEAEYVGKNGRRFNKRMGEHFRPMIKCTLMVPGAMGAHYKKDHSYENITDFLFSKQKICNVNSLRVN